jgi:hypothetical protein
MESAMETTSAQSLSEALSFPAHFAFEAAEVATAGARDLETALALATHQCAALAAGVEATVGQAIADLSAAVASAEHRLAAAAAQSVALIEQAVKGSARTVAELPTQRPS